MTQMTKDRFKGKVGILDPIFEDLAKRVTRAVSGNPPKEICFALAFVLGRVIHDNYRKDDDRITALQAISQATHDAAFAEPVPEKRN